MADIKTAEERSRNMAAIRSNDTKPEMLVRRYLHGMGGVMVCTTENFQAHPI